MGATGTAKRIPSIQKGLGAKCGGFPEFLMGLRGGGGGQNQFSIAAKGQLRLCGAACGARCVPSAASMTLLGGHVAERAVTVGGEAIRI